MASIAWPEAAVDVGLVETVGGVRSPLAEDGDSRDLVRALAVDVVVLVADAGLGTIDAVRSGVDSARTAARRRAAQPVHSTPTTCTGATGTGSGTETASTSSPASPTSPVRSGPID